MAPEPRGSTPVPRIIFLNRFFFPDHSATSQILSDLAFALAADGRDVHVVTSRQRYDRPNARLAGRETIDGVTVTRVGTTEFGRGTLPGRAADYISCTIAMGRAADALTRPGDVLIAKTDPPLLSVLGWRIARRRRARLINWLQDVYPEVATETGVPMMNGVVAGGMARLRDISLRAAETNVVLGTAMAARLRGLGIAPDRIEIIQNWVDDRTIVPLSRSDNPLRRAWGLGERFVVGHSGNLGRTHDVEPLLIAADRLRDRTDIAFVFIGGGTRFDGIRSRIEASGLGDTVQFFPYQDRETLPLSLTLPDLHWLSLRPSLEGLIFPSKFYGIAAAGRPMLALTAPDGEIAGLIARHGCGVAVMPGDTDATTRAIEQIAADPAGGARMGHGSRTMLDAHFSRAQALARWRKLLDRAMA
jgi:glycosyltransferase involved in cell wall biosynthesis